MSALLDPWIGAHPWIVVLLALALLGAELTRN